MKEEIIKWLPLIIAFIAGSYALHQIRSNNITNARIKWLDNLKTLISDFFSECADLIIKENISNEINERRKSEPINERMEAQLNRINESLLDHFKMINSKHDLIKLNLNPKEELHQKFESLFDAYMALLNKIPTSKNTYEELGVLIKKMDTYSDVLILLTRYILKLEWEKTKRSYFFRKYYMKFGKGKNLLKEALVLTPRNKVEDSNSFII